MKMHIWKTVKSGCKITVTSPQPKFLVLVIGQLLQGEWRRWEKQVTFGSEKGDAVESAMDDVVVLTAQGVRTQNSVICVAVNKQASLRVAKGVKVVLVV